MLWQVAYEPHWDLPLLDEQAMCSALLQKKSNRVLTVEDLGLIGQHLLQAW